MAPVDVQHLRRWGSRLFNSGSTKTWPFSALQACRRGRHVLAIFDLADNNRQIDSSSDQPQFWCSQHDSDLAPDGAGNRLHLTGRAAILRLGWRKQAVWLIEGF